MGALGQDLYVQWRAEQEARALLGESTSPHPPERLLQSVWHHQRLRREELRTSDGHPVRVLHPGFWNRGAGPDFRGAVLQFGQEEPRSGDVEIDLVPQNWQAHQHHTNEAFAGVILHVVWTGGAEAQDSARRLLTLEKYLDIPLDDLQKWGAGGSSEQWAGDIAGSVLESIEPAWDGADG